MSQSALQRRNAVTATRLVSGPPRFLDPQKSETPEPIDIKLDSGDYVEGLTTHANFGISTLKGVHMLLPLGLIVFCIAFYNV